MGAAPFIRQGDPLPSLLGLAMAGFELWRLRRVTAGLARANARGDSAAAARWLIRGVRAVADLDKAQDRIRPQRRIR